MLSIGPSSTAGSPLICAKTTQGASRLLVSHDRSGRSSNGPQLLSLCQPAVPCQDPTSYSGLGVRYMGLVGTMCPQSTVSHGGAYANDNERKPDA